MTMQFVYPGPKARNIGMGPRSGRRLIPRQKPCFDEGKRSLGRKAVDADLEGDATDSAGALTQNAQPALMATSMAAKWRR